MAFLILYNGLRRDTPVKNRFWEFYLVRYLAGTIFGVVILFYLFHNYNEEISRSFYGDSTSVDITQSLNKFLFYTQFDFEGVTLDKVKLDNNELLLQSSTTNGQDRGSKVSVLKNEVTILSMVIVVVAGFLFMYISSMLVLFLHTVRYRIYGLVRGGRGSPLFYFYLVLSGTRARGKQYELIGTAETPEQAQVQLQEEQSRAWVNEYVESYRHLREHGNAFGILISEIAFAGYLIITDFNVRWLMGWLALGFFSWWVASYLEVKLERNHTHIFNQNGEDNQVR